MIWSCRSPLKYHLPRRCVGSAINRLIESRGVSVWDSLKLLFWSVSMLLTRYLHLTLFWMRLLVAVVVDRFAAWLKQTLLWHTRTQVECDWLQCCGFIWWHQTSKCISGQCWYQSVYHCLSVCMTGEVQFCIHTCAMSSCSPFICSPFELHNLYAVPYAMQTACTSFSHL